MKCCMDEVLLCAEFTGRYIYPLAVACHEEEAFLWMEDPSRIKNSFGLVRGKSDSVDARRIAEYAFRHQDKAVAMVVFTDAFTRFDNARQFNCYAGQAPFTYTSGKSIYSKAKVSQRADKQIKALLHLAAVCVATHMKSGDYKEYYDRRVAEGKHPLCVLNVIRAKLVSRMFAVIKRDEPYIKNYDRPSSEKKLSTPLQIS